MKLQITILLKNIIRIYKFQNVTHLHQFTQVENTW